MQEAEPGGQLGNTAVEAAVITWAQAGRRGHHDPGASVPDPGQPAAGRPGSSELRTKTLGEGLRALPATDPAPRGWERNVDLGSQLAVK